MNRLILRAAGVCLAVLSAACSTHKEAFTDAKTEIGNQDEVIRSLTSRNDALTAENSVLRTRAEAAELDLKRLHGLEADFTKATTSVDDLEKRLREYEAKQGQIDADVMLKADRRGMKYEVAERLLFEPGKATLRQSGLKVLEKIAGSLRDGTEKIIVEGHTDDRPIVVHAKEYPRGNLELAGERALNVADYLKHGGGLAPNRVSYAGYGEHDPVVANDSDAHRAKNRRVEIIIVRNPPTKTG
jgi:flagellar motor protein MotB